METILELRVLGKTMGNEENNNYQHLKLLSIFHYVLGGLVAASSLFSLFHIGIGLSFILSPNEFPPPDTNSFPPELFGWFFFIGGLVWLIFGFTLSICSIASGRFLSKRKRYWFSFIVACGECLFTPLGTILGIFTIVLLSKGSVKALYGLSKQ